MSLTEFYSIIPLVVLSILPIAIMLSIAIKRFHEVIFASSLLGLGAAFYSLFPASKYIPVKVTSLLMIDSYTLFFWGLLIAAAFFITLISYNTLKTSEENKEEFYIILFIALLGSSVLVASVHFVSFFLGLETLSVSLYVLISYLRKKEIAVEAGVKYLILAAASSAFLLFGMALMYNEFGTMDFYNIGNALKMAGFSSLSLGGFAMIIVAVGFKLAVVPFHMWTPDVYEGASSPVTAFIATISKGGMFALLLRFFGVIQGYNFNMLILIFSIIAIASMFVGNWLALLQNNVKRILAYSSIAHLGYLLVAFLAGGNLAAEAVAFYLVAYFVTTIGVFGVVAILSTKEREAYKLDDYKGLFWRHPWLATAFSAMLLSLAGIPLTAGFIGKFYILAAGVNKTLWTLVIILAINSTIGLYYYLRIIVQMFTKSDAEISTDKFSYPTSLALFILTFMLIYFGVYPAEIINLIKSMVGNIV
jgi:NADH-quinone oxidoreductase subunit N